MVADGLEHPPGGGDVTAVKNLNTNHLLELNDQLKLLFHFRGRVRILDPTWIRVIIHGEHTQPGLPD